MAAQTLAGLARAHAFGDHATAPVASLRVQKLKAWLSHCGKASHCRADPQETEKAEHRSGSSAPDERDIRSTPGRRAARRPPASTCSAGNPDAGGANRGVEIRQMLHTRCADDPRRATYRVYGAVTRALVGRRVPAAKSETPPNTAHGCAHCRNHWRRRTGSDYEATKARYGDDTTHAQGTYPRSMLRRRDIRLIHNVTGVFPPLKRPGVWRSWPATTTSSTVSQLRCRNRRDLYCTTAERARARSCGREKSRRNGSLGRPSSWGLGYQMGGGRLLTSIRKARTRPRKAVTEGYRPLGQ